MSSDNNELKVVFHNFKYAVKRGDEVIVPFGKYAWIEGYDRGLCRVRTEGFTQYDKNCGVESNGRFVSLFDSLTRGQEKESIVMAKWGIIDEVGNEVLPVEYDEVWKFYGKGRLSTIVVKNGIKDRIYLNSLNPNIPLPNSAIKMCHDLEDSYEEDFYTYGRTFGEYAGTYAQDVRGFSDQEIDDIFDGEPDAYWNID